MFIREVISVHKHTYSQQEYRHESNRAWNSEILCCLMNTVWKWLKIPGKSYEEPMFFLKKIPNNFLKQQLCKNFFCILTSQNHYSFFLRTSLWRTSLTTHTLKKVVIVFPRSFREIISEFRKAEMFFLACFAQNLLL